MNTKLLSALALFLFSLSLFLPLAFGADAQTTASSTAFTVSFENPVETIVSIYNFALMGSGALAFGVIVYASIKLGVSGGNPSAVSDARDQLTQAGLGLLLLFGAAIILRTINPGITNLSLPGLSVVKGLGSTPIDPEGGEYAPTGKTQGPGCAPNCQRLTDRGIACQNQSSCLADESVATGLECMKRTTGLNFTVTEAYPPTITHISKGHSNGCSVDIKLTPGPSSCDDVKKIVDSANGCGLGAVGEYYNVCAGSDRYGKKYPTTTGEHIHVNGCYR